VGQLDWVVGVGDVDDPPSVVVAVEREPALECDVGADVPHAVRLAFECRGMWAMPLGVDVRRVRARGVVGARLDREREHRDSEHAENEWTKQLAHRPLPEDRPVGSQALGVALGPFFGEAHAPSPEASAPSGACGQEVSASL
jgi:hypothetical protein